MTLFANVKTVIGAVAGGAVAFGLFTMLNTFIWLPNAREEGRATERALAAERAAALIKRMETSNDQLRKMSVGDLCRELSGGMQSGDCPD